MSDAMRTLRETIETTPAAELPALIGEIEALKAAAWARLTAPVTPTPSTPAALADAAGMARILGTTEHWVRDKGRAGKIPTVELGHYVRFEPAAVIEAVRKLRLSAPQSHNGQLRAAKTLAQNQRSSRPGVHEVSKTSGADGARTP